ncbi:MAG: preprotein translocase subunit SecG, partial [Verrucomicrobiaceae bacterium]
MLTFFIYLVGTLLVLVCLLIVLLVLMQRPKQEGLGAAFGAGVTDQIWGSQTTNVLQKGTVWFGVCFFVLSILLTILEARKSKELTNMEVPTTTVTPPAPPVLPTGAADGGFPVTPTTPVTPAETTPVTPVPAVPTLTPAPVPAPAETVP